MMQGHDDGLSEKEVQIFGPCFLTLVWGDRQNASVYGSGKSRHVETGMSDMWQERAIGENSAL